MAAGQPAASCWLIGTKPGQRPRVCEPNRVERQGVRPRPAAGGAGQLDATQCSAGPACALSQCCRAAAGPTRTLQTMANWRNAAAPPRPSRQEEEAQQQMALMQRIVAQEEVKQAQTSAMRLTEKCFSDCANNFRVRTLDSKEELCVNRWCRSSTLSRYIAACILTTFQHRQVPGVLRPSHAGMEPDYARQAGRGPAGRRREVGAPHRTRPLGPCLPFAPASLAA